MTSLPQFTAADIYWQGERFLAAYRKLREQIVSEMELRKEQGLLLIPAYILLAFSCELFLKSLLLGQGTRKSGHSLGDLFSDLDARMKSEIKFEIESQPRGNDPGFDADLDVSSRTFVDWRYLYERSQGKEVRVEFLERLAFELTSRILASNPGWKQVFV